DAGDLAGERDVDDETFDVGHAVDDDPFQAAFAVALQRTGRGRAVAAAADAATEPAAGAQVVGPGRDAVQAELAVVVRAALAEATLRDHADQALGTAQAAVVGTERDLDARHGGTARVEDGAGDLAGRQIDVEQEVVLIARHLQGERRLRRPAEEAAD